MQQVKAAKLASSGLPLGIDTQADLLCLSSQRSREGDYSVPDRKERLGKLIDNQSFFCSGNLSRQLSEAQNKDARRAPEVLHSSADGTEAPPRTVAVFVKASAKHLQHVLEVREEVLTARLYNLSRLRFAHALTEVQ
ncbi:hypothetical protein F2P79_006609 [Pimephales promelas]|nr:hypothetical protein F2P79_006609 [Pimephales promelas]